MIPIYNATVSGGGNGRRRNIKEDLGFSLNREFIYITQHLNLLNT